MIQIDKYSKKYKIALERRKSPQFVSMLDSELKGSEWVEQLAACQLSLDNITKAADFETKENAIKSLFNQLYEKITAPGLDAFIGWIGSLTTSKNAENIKAFKKFLKDNYDKDYYSAFLNILLSFLLFYLNQNHFLMLWNNLLLLFYFCY